MKANELTELAHTDLLRWGAWLSGMLPDDQLSSSRISHLVSEYCDRDLLAQVNTRLRRFIAGEAEVSPVELYATLEQCTPVILFHVLPRKGKRNQYHSGVQQSYGDHIRLLLLGIEKLQDGDIAWFKTRTAPGEHIAEEVWTDVFRTHARPIEDRQAQVALWIAASLHDFGKLAGAEFGLDAEDGVPLAEPILDALVPAEDRWLVEFAIRNHDLIEYTRSGETPSAFVSRQLQTASDEDRARALLFLGMIQLAGAASLGDGRITSRKLSIYRDCATGAIVSDVSDESRVAKLLRGEAPPADDDGVASFEAYVANLEMDQQDQLHRLLSETIIRGWVPASSTIIESGRTTAEADILRLKMLTTLGEVADEIGRPDFLILTDSGSREIIRKIAGKTPVDVSLTAAKTRPLTLLSGSRAGVI